MTPGELFDFVRWLESNPGYVEKAIDLWVETVLEMVERGEAQAE